MKIAGVDIRFDREVGLRTPVEERPLLFRPYALRGVTMRNRIMLGPMSQYLSDDGVPTDWHLVHLGQFAMGGAGLVFAEDTAVEPIGRRTLNCTGLYTTQQAKAWRRITDFLRGLGAVPAIQLGHCGNRASGPSPYERRDKDVPGRVTWPTVSSSPISITPGKPPAAALDRAGIAAEIETWRRSTELALEAGFDVVEIHGAHGYLINQFLSPLANTRDDAYGGDLEGRMRFALEVAETVRSVLPPDKVLFFRVSAVDGAGGIWDMNDTVALARELKERGVDLIDCSSGLGGVPGPTRMPGVPRGMPAFHAVYSEHVRREAGIPTAGAGLITEPEQAEAILREERADLVAMAREMMVDPYWPARAARKLGLDDWIEVLPPTYAARLEQREAERRAWIESPGEVPFYRPAER